MSRILSQSAAISFAMLLAFAIWAPTVAPVNVPNIATVSSPVLA